MRLFIVAVTGGPGDALLVRGRVRAGLVFILLAFCQAARADSLYQIGNSFTLDSGPNAIAAMSQSAGLTLEVGYHVRCGSSLPGIVGNAESTCVAPAESGRFSQALPNNAWDHLAIQSFPGSTLGQDIDAYLELVDLARQNPANAQTRLYLYQSWPEFSPGADSWADWESPVTDSPGQPSVRRRDYYALLNDKLEGQGLSVTTIPQAEVLFRVREEIALGNVPGFVNIQQFYRDSLHMNEYGKFLAGTTVLTTILQRDLTGLPIPEGLYGGLIDDARRDLFQSLVWDVVRHHPDTDLPATNAPGDFNGDGVVRLADRAAWQGNFGSTINLEADGNRDGKVDAADYTVWRDAIRQSPGDYYWNEIESLQDYNVWAAEFGQLGASPADGNRDGVVDAADYTVWRDSLKGPIVDYTGDGIATTLDYTVWRSQFGIRGAQSADGNRDGVVDAADYTLWRDRLEAIPTSLLATIPTTPEPSAFVLLVGASLVLAASNSRCGYSGRATLRGANAAGVGHKKAQKTQREKKIHGCHGQAPSPIRGFRGPST